MFNKIGIIGRASYKDIKPTLELVCNFCLENNILTYLDKETANILDIQQHNIPILTRDEIGQQCDLAIIVGGDGSILNAARTLAYHNIAVTGIHRGRLGFLTDIAPDSINQQLTSILQGNFKKQELTLLHADIIRDTKVIKTIDAVNEVVLNSGNVTRMIEFDVYIDEQFVASHRSDGLIIATPTGSTAYALSGGGPILTPELNALVLVPMFAHNLTSRPIVVSNKSKIKITSGPNNQNRLLNGHMGKVNPGLSCDGQPIELLEPSDNIEIYKSDKILHLLHPSDYNYYETLRKKLHWNRRPIDQYA